MTDANKRVNIALEMSKVRSLLGSAERNAAAGDFDAAANRFYYAALHAARACLLARELEPKTHRGIKDLLLLRFEKAGLVPDGTQAAFSRLESERTLSDYAADYNVDEATCDRCRAWATTVVSACEGFLVADGWLDAAK